MTRPAQAPAPRQFKKGEMKIFLNEKYFVLNQLFYFEFFFLASHF